MKALIPILIYVLIPLAGLKLYLNLCKKMNEKGVKDAPFVELFLLFVNYGGWLLIFLTLICWYWSGMALLGAAYLFFVSPIITLFISVRLHFRRNLSSFHSSILLANIVYLVLTSILVIIFLLGQKS